jgi:hypothetical protein
MIEIQTTCPHCDASLCIGECTCCFWAEEVSDIIIHGCFAGEEGLDL